MRIGQVVIGIAVVLLCLAPFAPSQDEGGATSANKACDELRRLLSELASEDRFARVAAEKQLHECCELLSRTLADRASLTPEKTLLGLIERRKSSDPNMNGMDATPALAMRLLGELRTTNGIRDRLRHIDYVATISAFSRRTEAGLDWLLVRPAAYSIFKLGSASTPEIIAHLSETTADSITQEQIDLLAKLLVYTHSDPRSALRTVRAGLTTLPPYAMAENLFRLDKALTILRDR